MFAEVVSGYPVDWSGINSFLHTPDNSLTEWEDQGGINVLADYGQAFLWAAYLTDHYSTEAEKFLSRFMHIGAPGIEGIDLTLAALGFDERFEDVFNDWKLANLIHSGDGKYDYVSIDFDDCLIQNDNILGSPEVKQRTTTRGFKGVMKTFDATRPLIAASSMGIARAAIEFVKDALTKEGIEIRYDAPRHKLTAVERDVLEMEAQHKAAWLLTLRSVSMLDQRKPNALESSMCKAKAGKAVTLITQKAVEILGPLGYSREFLVEKWMRDAKINDLFEGTGQINLLIVARRILDYTRRELK